MNIFLYSFAAVLTAASLFALGFVFGGNMSEKKRGKPADMTAAEKERLLQSRRRLEEEQAAFSMLIGYNPDVAYGMADGYYDTGREE